MTETKQKILFLITKSNFGGAQRYVFDLAVGLPKNKFEVVVALGGSGELINKLQSHDIRVISIPSLERDLSIVKEVHSFIKIWQIVNEEKPDTLHINSSKAGVLGSLVGRLLRVPKVVFTSHGWAFNEDRPRWQKVVLKTMHWLTVLLSHKTIAVSQELKRQMNWPFASRKITVVHNGREIKELHTRDESRTFIIEKEPRLALYKNDFWSLTIGELHKVKRHDAMIETMIELVKANHNVRHLIIGSGEEEENLKKMIVKNNLAEHVFLLGAIPDASQYLEAVDVFVLPSRSEGMPYVIIEALLAHVPTVATRVGGIPEMIEDKVSGILVPPLDNKALFKAIFEVYSNANLRDELSQGAKECSQNFTFEKTLEETMRVYEN